VKYEAAAKEFSSGYSAVLDAGQVAWINQSTEETKEQQPFKGDHTRLL